MNAPINRSWSTATAVNAHNSAARPVAELPRQLQQERAELQAALDAVENSPVSRPAGSPSFEALQRQHNFPGSRSLLRETGLNDTELLVNGARVDFDKIAAKIVTRANEVTNPQMLESYAELFVRLSKILRSNVEPVKQEHKARAAYDIYRDELQSARAALKGFEDRVSGMTDHEIQTLRHAEELQLLRDEYEQRFKALEAAAGK